MLKGKLMGFVTNLLLLGVVWFTGVSAYNYYNNWVVLQYDKNISSIKGGIDDLHNAGEGINTKSVAEFGKLKTTGSLGLGSVSISVGYSTGPSAKISLLGKNRILISFFNMRLTDDNCHSILGVVSNTFDGILYSHFNKRDSFRKNKKYSIGVDDICADKVQEFQTIYSIKTS